MRSGSAAALFSVAGHAHGRGIAPGAEQYLRATLR